MLTLHIGTYEKSGGRGLVPLTVSDDGTVTAGAPFIAASNASFGARASELVYLADETDDGAITVLRSGNDGWERLARVATRGAAPCFVALDRDAARLAVANYASGSVALFALDARGLPMEPPALFQSTGDGPVAGRQDGPHAHCVRFSAGGEGLYWVDLGADRIGCLDLGPMRSGRAVFLNAGIVWRAPPGSGPRHLLFHPRGRVALVLSELASTLTLLHRRDGGLQPHQAVSTLPPEFSGESLGGHLELSADGTRVYASNRGHDSIAVFALEGNRLELIQHAPSGGAHPRHFALVERERLLVVAHEKDGLIALFKMLDDGTLAPKGEGTTVPGACFVLA